MSGTDAETRAIARLVARYADALHRCDVELMREVFHPAALYAVPEGEGVLHRSLPDYLDVLARGASPQSRGEPNAFRLDSVDFAGPRTALARVSGRMLGNAYTDLLSLVQVGGRWQVIAKVFHAEPAGR